MKYIIGSGGVGSWLAPSLCLLCGNKNVTLIDGDRLEEGNLNRQLFTRQHIGQNKAVALSRLYGCAAIPERYAMGRFRITELDLLMVCVDNHPARNAALNECDARGCRAIIAANETHSSEAYYYQREWQGSPLDPRVYYPDITQNRDGDPLAAGIGCTGQAQEQNRQLVSANFSAASLAQHLFVVWEMEAPKLNRETLASLPYKIVSNLTKVESFRVKDAERTTNGN